MQGSIYYRHLDTSDIMPGLFVYEIQLVEGNLEQRNLEIIGIRAFIQHFYQA